MDDDESAAKARRDLLVRALRHANVTLARAAPPPKPPRTGDALRVEAELAHDLERAGAPTERARSAACSMLDAIDRHVADAPRRAAGEPDGLDLARVELEAIQRLATDLQARLLSLSQQADICLRIPATPPPRFGMFGRMNYEPEAAAMYGRRFDLAQELGALSRLAARATPLKRTTAGPKPSGARDLMAQLAKDWHAATGALPTSTVEGGKAQADLHAAIVGYFKAVNAPEAASKGTGDTQFREAVADARAFVESPIKGMNAAGLLFQHRLKKRTRRSGKAESGN